MDAEVRSLDDLLDWSGLSLAEVCRRAGLTERSLLRLRHGLVARARVSTVKKLAAALGVSPIRVRRACQFTRSESTEED